MLAQSDGPLSLLKLFDGVSQLLTGIRVEIARDHDADTDSANQQADAFKKVAEGYCAMLILNQNLIELHHLNYLLELHHLNHLIEYDY
jgi:thiamine monophosphate synthase